MIRAPIKILMLCAAAILVIVVFRARAGSAEARCAAAAERFRATAASADEVQRLRAAEANVTLSAQPAEDVTPLVSSALMNAGLPSASLRSISPASTASMRGRSPEGGLRVQSVKLTLEDLTPQDLGRFLVSWRESQHIWTPSHIELHHPPTSIRSNGAPGSRPSDSGKYTVHITLTGYYLEDAA